ncbi:Uncharacterised protein [Legionella sainthelensi]|uniref:hypothetical protein n=1 Tax=Legionella sainthelensi TaxID=28087 RepID=UPI000E20BC57|nr:hypothetical protein [Legionella sainthelensi]VEB37760.1 Uncharacterised protein [Legionella sainthelensi]
MKNIIFVISLDILFILFLLMGLSLSIAVDMPSAADIFFSFKLGLHSWSYKIIKFVPFIENNEAVAGFSLIITGALCGFFSFNILKKQKVN